MKEKELEEKLKKFNQCGQRLRDVDYEDYEKFRKDFNENVNLVGQIKKLGGIIPFEYPVKEERVSHLLKLMRNSYLHISDKDWEKTSKECHELSKIENERCAAGASAEQAVDIVVDILKLRTK